ncbi:MAG TPA: hypothetical protein PLM75_13585 [bacterium]|nr:hypothetical protein [bacterium]
MKRDKKFSRLFLTKFQDKILFGTDTYELGQRELIEKIQQRNNNIKKIFKSNIEKIID